MKTKNIESISSDVKIISWLFATVFLVCGVLNIFLVDFVPGVLYLLLSFVYFPQTNTFLKKKIGWSIPFFVKIILGLVILWGTLAVGDLAEVLGL